MKKEMIAVDVDDVLATHVETFIAHSNTTYGTSLNFDDYSERWGAMWGVDSQEVERRALEFQTSETILNFDTKPDAKKALHILRERYDLSIVTARRKHLIDTTYQWVEKHFPNIFEEVHFVPIWEPNSKVTKADICKQIKANYLIDDIV